MGGYINWPLAEIMQQVIQGHMAGTAQKQRREQLDQEKQDRDLQRQHLKLAMDALKLDEAWKEKAHQMDEAHFLQSIATPQFGVQNQMQAPGPETSLRSQGDQGPGPQFSPVSIGQSQVLPPHVVGGPMGDLPVPGLQENLQRSMMAKLQEAMMGAKVAGVKAGEEARATQPYAMEKQAAGQQFTADQKRQDREFEARQKALDRANHLEAARLGQENKNLSSEAATRLATVTTMDGLAEGLKKDLSGAGRLKLAKVVAGLDTDINRRLDDLVDASIRIRTGAAATKQEVAERRGQIIRALDVYSGDTGPMIAAIERMQGEAKQTASALDPQGRFPRQGVTASATSPKLPPAGQVLTMPDGTKWKRQGSRMVRQ